MIYELNREKASSVILSVIREQRDDVLQKLYAHFADSEVLPQSTILALWHGFVKLESLSNAAVEDLIKFLSGTYSIGQRLDYYDEIDASEIKKAYIQSITGNSTRVAAMRCLDTLTEAVESVYQKDLCRLTKDEAVQGLLNLPIISTPSLRQTISIARGYCAWCMDHKKYNGEAGNPFKSIKPDDVPIDSWVERNVAQDPRDLVRRMNAEMPVGKGSFVKVVAALAWMGFSINECTALTDSDLEMAQKRVCDRPIPNELEGYFIAYIAERTLRDQEGFALSASQQTLLRIVGRDKQWRPCKNSDISNSFFVFRNLTFRNVELSAQLYNLYVIEQTKQKLDEDDFIEFFRLNPESTSFRTYLKDKRRLYSTYKRVYWDGLNTAH